VTAELAVRDGHDKLDVFALKSWTVTQVSESIILTLTDRPIADVDAVVAVRAQVPHF